jgi:hypothetical protein
MKKRNDKVTAELRRGYDLRQLLKGGLRGKYANRYHAGTNLVLLAAPRSARKGKTSPPSG